MPAPSKSPGLDPRELGDLSALADGSLHPARRAAVQERIAASPELSALYARERRVVEVLHKASQETGAPAALRARVAAERPDRRVLARRRAAYTGGLGGALAAVALALVLILPAGTPGAPSISQAAALAGRGPVGAAPATVRTTPGKLNLDVEEVYFPNWAARFGWRAIGQRTDRLNGRIAATVYYRWRGRILAYTIVGAPALRTPAAPVSTLNGTQLRTLRLNGRVVVTWRRSGHTCVLSGHDVPPSLLQRLAVWKLPGVSS